MRKQILRSNTQGNKADERGSNKVVSLQIPGS